CVLNVDETGIYYDSPPRYAWVAKNETPAIKECEKHSTSVTAVLAVRQNGTKLPIMFNVKACPGGTIENTELDDYPEGHLYAVQRNGWMDRKTWDIYLRRVLQPHVSEDSVILLDGFDAHKTPASRSFIETELQSKIALHPSNSTQVCQPLDVGVMGPFKQKLRRLWLEEQVDASLDPALDDDELTPAEKRLKTIERAIAAWESISEETVRKSFKKAIPVPDVLEVSI
ncbi:hypothetical protein ACHHYP_07143, partial [Achlya hypogyna]